MRNRSLLAAAVFAAMFTGACGKKAAPIPPERLVPREVKVSSARNEAGGIRLVWAAPKKRINGRPLEGLRGFVVLRSDGASKIQCAGPTASFQRVGYVAASSPKPDEGVEYAFVDRTVVPGRWYAYRVLAEDEDGGLSNPAPNEPVLRRGTPPPRAPAPVTTVGDGFLTFRMPPFPDDVHGWFLYRAATDGVLPAVPFSEAITKPEFTDAGLTNDEPHRYAAAWLRQEAGFPIEGPLSPWIKAAAHDLVPPAPPEELIGIARQGIVDLRWQRVDEPGVRYHIYRRPEAEPAYARVTTEPVAGNTLLDQVPPGQYVYSITSVDEAGNESPRGAEARVRVR